MTAPLVSVVVPTRNRVELVLATLHSVLEQRDVELEVVVVDDGSTDGTADRVVAVADPRVRGLRLDERQGVSSARNAGVAMARGTWIAFLDDDDLWAPDKLAAQLAAADGCGWVVSGAVCVDDRLQVLSSECPRSPEQMARDVVRYNSVPVGASNVLVRRDVLDRAGPFDPQLRHMADWDLWIRLARHDRPALVRHPHVAYRLHAGSATVDTGFDPRQPLAELDVIRRRYQIHVDRAAVHRWVGWSAMRAGRRRAAVTAYLRAAADGDAASALRSVVAATHPALGRRTFFTPRRHGKEDQWSAEARAWLRDLERP